MTPSKGWVPRVTQVPTTGIVTGFVIFAFILFISIMAYQFCGSKYKTPSTVQWEYPWDWDVWDDFFHPPEKRRPKPLPYIIPESKLAGFLKYHASLLQRRFRRVKIVPGDGGEIDAGGGVSALGSSGGKYSVSGRDGFRRDELDDMVKLNFKSRLLSIARGDGDDNYVREFTSLDDVDDASLAGTLSTEAGQTDLDPSQSLGDSHSLGHFEDDHSIYSISLEDVDEDWESGATAGIGGYTSSGHVVELHSEYDPPQPDPQSDSISVESKASQSISSNDSEDEVEIRDKRKLRLAATPTAAFIPPSGSDSISINILSPDS